MRLQWIGRCLVLLVGLIIGVAVVVLLPAKLVGWSVPEPDRIGDAYLYSLTALPLSWPLYMTALAAIARRVRRPRRWAIALSPLLGAWFAFLLIFVADTPDFYAAWLLWLSYGALVPLPPDRPRPGGRRSTAPVASGAQARGPSRGPRLRRCAPRLTVRM